MVKSSASVLALESFTKTKPHVNVIRILVLLRQLAFLPYSDNN